MSETIVEFWKPDWGTIEVGSLVWYYNMCTLFGPLHVVEIRHAGYGQGAKKKWILFDSSKDRYYTADWYDLRVPREREICN